MKQGVVIFAFNNQIVDYVKMAQWSAQRISKLLDLPTCLITDDKTVKSNCFDKIITIDHVGNNTKYYQDFNVVADWHNMSRYTAYELTPYQTTMVLDADYVVNNNQLRQLFFSDYDFFCHRHAIDITGSENFKQANFFGNLHLPMSWATVVVFKKTKFSELVFYLIKMIKNNWTHYRNLYQISNSLYRNDFALSIALNILNGQVKSTEYIPWNLLSIMPEHDLQQIEETTWKIGFRHQQQHRYMLIKDQDFHALGKRQLGEIVVRP